MTPTPQYNRLSMDHQNPVRGEGIRVMRSILGLACGGLPSTSTQAKTIQPPQNCYRVPANVQIEPEGVAWLRGTANTCSVRCSSSNGIIIFSGCWNPQMTNYIAF